MRLSLKDLLALVTFVAVIAGCAAQVGFTNWLFWIYAVFALLMSWRFVRAVKRDEKRRTAWTVPIPFLLGSLLLTFGSMALWVNGGLLILCGVVVAAKPRLEPRTLVAMTLLCMLASCILGVYVSGSGRRELLEARQAYPIRSLAQRLNYEPEKLPATSLILKRDIDKGLGAVEETCGDQRYVNYQLKQIHGRYVENFASALGFGITRMPYPSPRRIERPALRDIGFADRDIVPPNRSYGSLFLGIERNPRQALTEFHRDSYLDFLNPEGFGGLINPPTEVAGFVEHGFHHPPSRYESGLAWDLERLELVSLLKFDEPRVYVLDHLPRMDQLSGDDVPTRPLDKFESAALPRLRTDGDVVIDEVAGDTRMLGSLRAAKQCLDCHNAARGELLGAFSYVLRQERYPLAPK